MAGVVENYQPTNVSVVETVQSTAEQITDDKNVSPIIGNVSPTDPQVRPLAAQRTPTLEADKISLTVFEAENQEKL